MTTQPADPAANLSAEKQLPKQLSTLSKQQPPSNSSQSNSSQSSSSQSSSSQSTAPQLTPVKSLNSQAIHPPLNAGTSTPGATPTIFPLGHPVDRALAQQNATPGKQKHLLMRLIKGLFWATVFGSTALTAAALGTVAVLSFPLPRQVSGETVAPPLTDLWNSGFRYQVSRPVNILIMGLDEARDVEGAQPTDLVGRTDTMLLARVDPEAKAINVMSIPRDTRVEIPGYGMDKINQANFEGGAELAAQTVMYNFNNVKIDRYVRVSTAAFREIVDLVGGIEVMVPTEMKYEDKTQGLVIDLEPGLQILNGDEAEQFARFRQDSYGDIGRVQRQQILLKALRKRLTNPMVLPKLPQIVRVLQSYIDTNLSLEELLALAGFGLNLDSQDMHMVMLPGEFSDPEEYSASFWIADSSATSSLMSTYFDAKPTQFVTEDAGDDINYYKPPSESVVSELRIAVQNATDDQYASSSMADHLRSLGFYNVYVMRDWSHVDRTTSVVAQRGDIGSARVLQDTIGIGQLQYDSTGDIESDITIRVGEDWLMQTNPDWQRLPYDVPR